jgi:hypothetical protein
MNKTLIIILLITIEFNDIIYSYVSDSSSVQTSTTESSFGKCRLINDDEYEKSLIPLFLSLKNKQFHVSNDEYDFFLGICVTANNSDHSEVGLVQIDKKSGEKYVIGRLSDVTIEGGRK